MSVCLLLRAFLRTLSVYFVRSCPAGWLCFRCCLHVHACFAFAAAAAAFVCPPLLCCAVPCLFLCFAWLFRSISGFVLGSLRAALYNTHAHRICIFIRVWLAEMYRKPWTSTLRSRVRVPNAQFIRISRANFFGMRIMKLHCPNEFGPREWQDHRPAVARYSRRLNSFDSFGVANLHWHFELGLLAERSLRALDVRIFGELGIDWSPSESGGRGSPCLACRARHLTRFS